MSDSYESAAYDHVQSSLADVEFELAAIIKSGDALSAYAKEFVGKCSLLSSDETFEVGEKLRRSLRGFKLKEWKDRVKRERETFQSRRSQPAGPAWKSLLEVNSRGNPLPILANVITALRNAPEWQGVFAFDELSKAAVAVKAPPFAPPRGAWKDASDILATDWMQHQGILVGRGIVADAIQAVAHDHPFHPVVDYLRSLKWDGKVRIERWLADYMGVVWDEFTGQAGQKWLISAVARVMEPGCQVDTCLVLEGEQGIYKSSAIRALAGDDWFTDQIADPTDIKESSQDLAGKWIVEISELDKYSKHEQGIIKSFIPRRKDHYRPSYGRHSSDFDRHCVFSATTNKMEYLGDETGGRRWWPVFCRRVNLDWIKEDRDQLWAEAVNHYDLGIPWHIPVESKAHALAKDAQSDRTINDSWFTPISEFIDQLAEQSASRYKAYSVSTEEILLRLGIPVQQFDDQKIRRVVKCLRVLGWEQYRESEPPRPRRYRKPENQ